MSGEQYRLTWASSFEYVSFNMWKNIDWETLVFLLLTFALDLLTYKFSLSDRLSELNFFLY